MTNRRNSILTSHVGEATEQQGQKEIEDDQVSHQDGSQKVWDTCGPGDVHAVPHGLDPLSTEYSEHNHEAVHEVREVPPRHGTTVPLAHVALVVLPEQLHPHHGEDEDDDAQNECEVRERADGVHHDGEDVIE